MRELWMGAEILCRIHDFGYSCFVIRAKKGIAVSYNQVFSDAVLERREFFFAENDLFVLI